MERNGDVCSVSVTDNCSTSTRIDLGSSGDYRFTHCTFTGCYVTNGQGGAIHLEGSSTSYASSLYIERCAFDSCQVKASQSGTLTAGALHCVYTETFVVTSSNFTACQVPNGQLSYNSGYLGGAVYGVRISSHISLSSCIFTRCKAGNQGGGVMLAVMEVSETTPTLCTSLSFINCTANSTYASHSSYTVNGYGGGGKRVLYDTMIHYDTPISVYDTLFDDTRLDDRLLYDLVLHDRVLYDLGLYDIFILIHL